ncbi:MAG: type II toxin-antitoxin system death-on-curing family toxin [Terracidiphilus sp.]|nr:type II toxin-antitoxin system death-on-curing family toxin [Terracidiphilus sp.]
MKEPIWIREIDALAYHAQLLMLFGGQDGIRDWGLFESALARPKNLLAYAETPVDMPALAAAYAFGLSSNHPFIDGNKRTAMQVALVFLEFNGIEVTATQEEACLTFLGLAGGDVSELALAEWFRQHIR